MVKFLFLDYREIETIAGFTRQLRPPAKCPANPLFTADQPWENGNMQCYGSVIQRPGKPFQCWYSFVHRPFALRLGYAESDDGLTWRKPLLDVWDYAGHKTNVVMALDPHGPAIIFDDADPREDWKYKMVCGALPSNAICAFHSADGVHWHSVRGPFPVLPTGPDCPMGLYRAADGRYVALHRLEGFGRRVFRSESWDFLNWTGEPRMIMEPDAADAPQVQFYGMGATAYGSYELGTLWMYHTLAKDSGAYKMSGYQEAELTYARQGHCWHRAAQGQAFIPHGQSGSWEQGNLQCASAPVFLDDEIRYYYAATTQSHQPDWELEPQTAGLGMASMKPDRFVALVAGERSAELVTCAFTLPSADLYVNAKARKNGWIKLELLDEGGNVIHGFTADQCQPVTGDATAMPARWNSGGALPVGQAVRLRVSAKNASVYSLFSCPPSEVKTYWTFTAARP